MHIHVCMSGRLPRQPRSPLRGTTAPLPQGRCCLPQLGAVQCNPTAPEYAHAHSTSASAIPLSLLYRLTPPQSFSSSVSTPRSPSMSLRPPSSLFSSSLVLAFFSLSPRGRAGGRDLSPSHYEFFSLICTTSLSLSLSLILPDSTPLQLTACPGIFSWTSTFFLKCWNALWTVDVGSFRAW